VKGIIVPPLFIDFLAINVNCPVINQKKESGEKKGAYLYVRKVKAKKIFGENQEEYQRRNGKIS